MSPRALFIVNPVARGAPSSAKLLRAAAWLEAQGWESTLSPTENKGHATELARDAARSGCDVVIACGGDGTVNEVANGLASSQTALAVIRGGTANVWAKETGIPRDPEAAVRLLVEGVRRRIDLGVAEPPEGPPRLFLLMAGVGLDAYVVSRIPGGLKRRLGAAAYVLHGFRELLRFRSRPTSLVIDGEALDIDLFWLLAANTRSYGGVINVAHAAIADDGLLDVYVFRGHGLRQVFMHGLRILTRRYEGAANVICRRAHTIEILSATTLDAQVDGDELGFVPRLLRVEPLALTVVLPANRKSPLFSNAPD